jgi:hypothetical protein
MAHARVARDPLGELWCARERQRLEELLGALVTKPSAVSRLTIVSPSTLKRKWPGLDDARRAPGPDRDLEDAFTLDGLNGKAARRPG